MAKSSGCSAVEKLVAFQETGRGFEAVWAEIDPIVAGFARSSLRNYGVRSPQGDDEWAVDDVVQQVTMTLLELGQPGATGRFDPARAQPGLSGLRGWLWRVVDSESVDWTRKFRGRRGRKLLVASDLEWNDPSEEADGGTFEKFFVAKIERPDLLPILEEAIGELPDGFMRRIVGLKLHHELSLRDTAEKLDVAVSNVQRTLKAAYGLLRPLVIARGVDEDWFDGLAA
jgi:RNA polymerase sigma factor (sigma-70 family)